MTNAIAAPQRRSMQPAGKRVTGTLISLKARIVARTAG